MTLQLGCETHTVNARLILQRLYALYLHISSSSSPLPMQPSQFWPITSPPPAIHFHHHHDYDRQHCHDHDHHQHCQRSHHHFDQQSITSCLPRVPATNQLFTRKYTSCKDKLLFIVQKQIYFSVDCIKIVSQESLQQINFLQIYTVAHNTLHKLQNPTTNKFSPQVCSYNVM